MISNVVVLIPSYNPDEKLPLLIAELREVFSHVVVVDDGSTTGLSVFDMIRSEGGGVEVVVHPRNRGKGAALKTGFRWIQSHYPEIDGIVTADSDGQHRPNDIEKIAKALLSPQSGIVLGVRAFTGEVPLRSRLGNGATRLLFRLLTGVPISDTQTGLRGIPLKMIPRLLEIPGDRYEYEMRMLADCKFHSDKPVQVSIETVYVKGNASSHFRPIVDSVKIWSALIRYVILKK